jgi:hypothetical protein
MEETQREHSREINSLTKELGESRSLLEEKTAEFIIANGIAAAASAQAQEHLQAVRAIQSELKSAKMGLLVQQEQLKQQEVELQMQQEAWMQEKALMMKQHANCEQELALLRQKLSHGHVKEDQALSVRSIIATSRALHPFSRAFFAWAAHVRKQQRIFRQYAARGQSSMSYCGSRRMQTLKLALLRWREFKCRNAALMRMEVGVMCLILHRRLKNFFGLWFQTAVLSNSACIQRDFSSSHNLLRLRVARLLINYAIRGREQNSHTLALLSHVIHAFSNVTYSTAFMAACASFKSVIKHSSSPSSLSTEAYDLFLLFSAGLKLIVEEKTNSNLHVSCRGKKHFWPCDRVCTCIFDFESVQMSSICLQTSIFNFICQSGPWSEVLQALSDVSSKCSKFVSIISNSIFRIGTCIGAQFTIHNLKSSNFEFDSLLLLSRSVVISTADEIYACMSIPSQKIAVSRDYYLYLQFFCSFLSCIRGYKRMMDVMTTLRQQVLVQMLRRLQGGLLISKVYVNSLVSARVNCENRVGSVCFEFFHQVCFHLSEEMHQAALHRSALHSANQSFESIPPPPSIPPQTVTPDVKWWFSDEDMNRHGEACELLCQCLNRIFLIAAF